MIIFSIILFTFVVLAGERIQKKVGLGPEEIEILKSDQNKFKIEKSPYPRIHLIRARGDLNVTVLSSSETYEAYFHIPIPFQEQVPILIEVESPQLIDYRFIHMNSPNVFIAARMRQAEDTELDWTAWVLVKENDYSDLPDSVAIPSWEQLPDSVKKWLISTDCSQLSAPIVVETGELVRANTTNLMELAANICSYCVDIPWEFPHQPYAFDAVYTLKWGNSCTGHAHAGAALFRANGIPARSLLNIPVSSGACDMHWIIDYYVPDYGWVRMETSTGQHPAYPQSEIVTSASNPEDEFCLFFPCAIDGCWHTSDPVLGMWNPEWSRAHTAYSINSVSDSPDKIKLAHSLTNSVFFYYSRYWGIELTSAQQVLFQDAYSFQLAALENLKNGNFDSYIANMQEALNNYKNVNPDPITTIFFDDFESGGLGWTHGGTKDEWELGTPAYGPEYPHSGTNCWATDLDDTYENSADNWLMSPPIDLTNQACAYLSFWVWNWVQDTYGVVYDPLWLSITTDGTTFNPLCSEMGGVNDDPEIPDVGGWSRVVLDLTRYVGNTVQIRFRFQSNANTVYPGSYIDDVHCYGRSPKDIIQHYTLTLSSGVGGTIDPYPGVHILDDGKEITVEAIPDANYRFNYWEGDVLAGSEDYNPLTFTMDSDKYIEAHFIRQYKLTTIAGTGGTTEPSPGSYMYDSGTDITVKAIPDLGYKFSQWSGEASGTDNQVTITMDRDKSITANFVQMCKLTLATSEGGTTHPSPGTHYYDPGEEVTVEASPREEYKFSHWSGDASGSGNPITVTMDRDKSITANFKEVSKGKCFIATAAYSSQSHLHVKILRDFRDKYLMDKKLGRLLVDLYYKYSPFLANLIAKYKSLKVVARINLLPVIAFSYLMLHFGPVITIIMLVLIFALSVFVISFFRRKLRRIMQTKPS